MFIYTCIRLCHQILCVLSAVSSCRLHQSTAAMWLRVLKALKAQGVKILALRCSGTDNVDIETAKEIGATVVTDAVRRL